jgi:hypothetical protein
MHSILTDMIHNWTTMPNNIITHTFAMLNIVHICKSNVIKIANLVLSNDPFIPS